MNIKIRDRKEVAYYGPMMIVGCRLRGDEEVLIRETQGAFILYLYESLIASVGREWRENGKEPYVYDYRASRAFVR